MDNNIIPKTNVEIILRNFHMDFINEISQHD